MISVIVPILNTKDVLLKKCLTSLSSQTYNNLEVLLVDGGSDNATLEIINDFAKKNANFKIIHTKKGTSHQRNVGLENAKGEYISFIDSDDYINKTYFDSLLKEIEKGCDIVNSNIILINNGRICNNLHKNIYLSVDANNFFDIVNQNIPIVYPIKLYKKSVIKDVKFDVNIKVGEDLFFNYDVVKHSGKINYCVCSSAEYYYNYYSDEIFLKKYTNKLLCNTYDKLIEIYNCTKNCDVIRYLLTHISIYYNYAIRHNVFIPRYFKKYTKLMKKSPELNLNIKQRLWFTFPHLYIILRKLKHLKDCFICKNK